MPLGSSRQHELLVQREAVHLETRHVDTALTGPAAKIPGIPADEMLTRRHALSDELTDEKLYFDECHLFDAAHGDVTLALTEMLRCSVPGLYPQP